MTRQKLILIEVDLSMATSHPSGEVLDPLIPSALAIFEGFCSSASSLCYFVTPLAASVHSSSKARQNIFWLPTESNHIKLGASDPDRFTAVSRQDAFAVLLDVHIRSHFLLALGPHMYPINLLRDTTILTPFCRPTGCAPTT